MKKKLFVVISLLSVGTFAYGSAIVSTTNSSPKGSALLNNNLTMQSSIIQYNSAGLNNSAELIKQFAGDKSNPQLALDAFKLYLANSKYKQASNVLAEHYISLKGNKDKMSYEYIDYLNSLKSNLRSDMINTSANSDVYAVLSAITLNTEDTGTALNYAQKARELNTKKYTSLLAKIYMINGDTEKAFELFNQQVQMYPSDYESLYYRAIILAKMGKTAEVKRDCTQLLVMNKYTNEVSAKLFTILDSENASDEKIIAALLPKNKGISVEKGYSILIPRMIKIKEYNVADKMIRNAENYNNQNVDLYLSAAEAYAQNGDYQTAKSYLEKSKRLLNSEEDISRFNIISASFSGEQLKGARDLALSGKYDDAIKLYERSSNPESVESLLGLANSYIGMGNNTKALGYLNKAMSLYPENAEVYYGFAKYFSDTNDIETARKYINNAMRLDSKNPKIIQLANKLKGQKLDDLLDEAFSAFDTQNYEQTLSILNKVIKLEPDNYTAYYYKGLTYGNMNNYSAAVSEFLKSKSLNPQFIFVNYLLGVAYDNLGETQEAKKYYDLYLNKETNINNENAEYINYARERVQKL